MTEPTKPNPGSDEAIKQGCECAVLDNGHGRGYMGQPDIFVVTETCPLHGRKETHLTLEQLNDHVCRWPVTDERPHRFCGQPTVEGKPYCETHCAAAYRPAPPMSLKRPRGA